MIEIMVGIETEDLARALSKLAQDDFRLRQISLADARLIYEAGVVIKREVERKSREPEKLNNAQKSGMLESTRVLTATRTIRGAGGVLPKLPAAR